MSDRIIVRVWRGEYVGACGDGTHGFEGEDIEADHDARTFHDALGFVDTLLGRLDPHSHAVELWERDMCVRAWEWDGAPLDRAGWRCCWRTDT